MLKQLVADYPDTPRYESDLAGALYNIARMLQARGERAKARLLVERAIRHQEAAVKRDSNNAQVRRSLELHQLLRDELAAFGP